MMRSDDPRGARREVPPILDSVLRAGEGKILRKLKRISEQINSIEEDFVAMSDAELRAMTDEFRQRHADGETLADLLPAYLNAIGGQGVPVVTVNDYPATRDSEWMGRVHHFLGLEVGVI